jgi:hypothetical protein
MVSLALATAHTKSRVSMSNATYAWTALWQHRRHLIGEQASGRAEAQGDMCGATCAFDLQLPALRSHSSALWVPYSVV